MTERPAAVPRKTVLPRKAGTEDRPVIALTRDLLVCEFMGDELFPAEDLGKVLCSTPSSIIAVQGFGLHLQRLQRSYGAQPLFNYRVTPIRRYSRAWDDGRRLTQGMIQDAVCNYVGWKAEGKAGRNNPNRYHYPLDPLWFLTSSIEELDDSNDVPIVKLYRWAKEVRDWCKANGIQAKASAGGIAAQLLRDSRFYPEPRRKAPRIVNNAARFRLPGNYYHLRAEVGKPYRALYLDMENAHHAMARHIRFPDANSLYGYGDIAWSAAHEDARKPRPFAHGNSPILNQPGLFFVSLHVPHVPREWFPPPYMENAGVRDVWLYSNELELVRSLGGEIRHVYAAYTSQGTEPGLNRYARWAIEQIHANREYRYWLKPTLHSTYGLLAARPLPFETGFWRAKGEGARVAYPMGNVDIRATAKIRESEIESRIVNVIHRGMIEAAVRAEALTYARFLTEQRERVLAIYADGIFIADRTDDKDPNSQLRFIHAPWRIKQEVTNLRFHSSTSFTSHELSRLPGVPRSAKDRYLVYRRLAEERRKLRREHEAKRHSRPDPLLGSTGRRDRTKQPSKGGRNATGANA